MTAAGAPRLRSLIERAAPAPAGPRGPAVEESEHCDLCGVSVPAEHRHVFDLRRRELLCACLGCKLLFDHDAAGGRHYRLIPDDVVRLEGFSLDDLAWRALGLPVQTAFFVRSGETGRIAAFYPSPAGTTESALELEAWEELERENPALAQLRPDVEALLVHGTGADREALVVGVDQCYRLVAVMRTHWKGFSGGDDVWREIDRFFGGLRAQARPAA